MRVPRSRKSLAALAGGTLSLTLIAAGTGAVPALAAGGATARPAVAAHPAAPGSCALGGGAIKHVIYLQFDNVHYTRDNPNVPSDLEQMPNLLNFITGNGTLISHEHTPLIAHTADDIVTSESGLYGSDQGVPVANEYHYYTSTGPTATTDQAGSFGYWTDPIVDYNTDYAGDPMGDSTTMMIGQNGQTPPAPWATYTRAGCDFGSVAVANTELENTAPDVANVFGANSADAAEGNDPNQFAKATADYEGLSVHCAKDSAICANYHSVPDLLPDEPGGYTGYRALFGAKYLDPLMNPNGPVTNFNGQVIQDSNGNVGFPGYDGMQGYNALAYTLDMQTHGVPVTYTYLTDVHDSWTEGGGLGPGSAQYESQLQQENAAFGTFFTQLAAHGITKANTLFVITADEGDHFVGSAPSPANCDGVHVQCTYSNVGEVDGNLTGMLAAKGINTPFDVQGDSSPTLYVQGQPGRTDPSVRALEQAAATLTATDVSKGTTENVTNYMADPVELKLLHMVTGDPKRTPTLAIFGNPEFWLQGSSDYAGNGSSCTPTLTCQPSGGDAWNHGTVAPEINTTFLGVVGPGVENQGVNNSLWSDHTDIQPTMWALLGLHADYTPDGRVLLEVINPGALPAAAHAEGLLVQLGELYKQLDAPVGAFGLDTLKASTMALASTSPTDATYTTLEKLLSQLGTERDAVASSIQALLLGATLDGHPVNAGQAGGLLSAGYAILGQAAQLAR